MTSIKNCTFKSKLHRKQLHCIPLIALEITTYHMNLLWLFYTSFSSRIPKYCIYSISCSLFSVWTYWGVTKLLKLIFINYLKHIQYSLINNLSPVHLSLSFFIFYHFLKVIQCSFPWDNTQHIFYLSKYWFNSMPFFIVSYGRFCKTCCILETRRHKHTIIFHHSLKFGIFYFNILLATYDKIILQYTKQKGQYELSNSKKGVSGEGSWSGLTVYLTYQVSVMVHYIKGKRFNAAKDTKWSK